MLKFIVAYCEQWKVLLVLSGCGVIWSVLELFCSRFRCVLTTEILYGLLKWEALHDDITFTRAVNARGVKGIWEGKKGWDNLVTTQFSHLTVRKAGLNKSKLWCLIGIWFGTRILYCILFKIWKIVNGRDSCDIYVTLLLWETNSLSGFIILRTCRLQTRITQAKQEVHFLWKI